MEHRFLTYLRSRPETGITIVGAGVCLLTALALPAATRVLSPLPPYYSGLFFLFCVPVGIGGFRCRSEWKGLMAGSVSALALKLLLLSSPLPFRSGFLSTPLETVGLFLLPLLAGFWGGWLGGLLAGGESRRRRLPAAVISVVALVCGVWNSADKQTPPAALAAPLIPARKIPEPDAPPRIENLGVIPHLRWHNIANDRSGGYGIHYLSPDGNALVGSMPANPESQDTAWEPSHAFVWTQRDGLTDLAKQFDTTNSSIAFKASADGSEVVGWWIGSRGDYRTGRWPFFYQKGSRTGRWPFIHRNGSKLLGIATPFLANRTFNDTVNVSLNGISPDGEYVLSYLPLPDGIHGAPFLWSQKHGLQKLDTVPQSFSSETVGPSGRWLSGSLDSKAAFWTKESGLRELGTLPGDTWSFARCATPKGDFVAGSSGYDHLFRWSDKKGMENLGTLPPMPAGALGSTVTFLEISADGKTIVGSQGGTPFLWTEAKGMQDLSPALIRSGVGVRSSDPRVETISLSPDAAYITGVSWDNDSRLMRWRLYLK